ncbi:hypothetical protein GUJ93_ZPchr0005g15487 [Zizania palustris]|uniref:Uncharacterized protein n=1 Tax=Zizania palustris TaxID=103762 RepID=A0A8J5S2W6_ZIZPA|nr:hypothetical protein GUJ93_ZPchr0005g15487 [Zizania palustris]
MTLTQMSRRLSQLLGLSLGCSPSRRFSVITVIDRLVMGAVLAWDIGVQLPDLEEKLRSRQREKLSAVACGYREMRKKIMSVRFLTSGEVAGGRRSYSRAGDRRCSAQALAQANWVPLSVTRVT